MNTSGLTAEASLSPPSSETDTGVPKRKPGRKPTTEEPASKRIAQVRANTKAFRERKAKYVKDLEETVAKLSSNANVETDFLKARVAALEAENSLLKQMQFTFSAPVSNIPTSLNSFTFQSATSGYTPNSVASVVSPAPPVFDLDSLLFPALDVPVPIPQFESFMDSHKDLDLGGFNLDADFLAILNTPIAHLPASDMDIIIEPHFAGVRKALLAMKPLEMHSSLVDSLCLVYMRFVEFGTRVCNPFTCRISIDRAKCLHARILAVFPDESSRNRAQAIFDAVAREFIFEFDQVFEETLTDNFATVLKTLPALVGELGTVDSYHELQLRVVEKGERGLQIRAVMAGLETRMRDRCLSESIEEAKVFDYLIESWKDVYQFSC
ncbi:hypothetical protein BC830DRAFT_1169019 [Chytriomyces sp. MP71]|nr:hypothetical protein BC830DRAFT_1169019 [Chytriomyces sp. MP71]